jgi:hypothetical protein
MKFHLPLLPLLFFANPLSAQNVGIGTTTPTNKLEVVSTVTSVPLATIYGTNTGTAGSAVYGVSNTAGTSGVQGTSNFGVGLYGYSSNYIALAATATLGTAAYASSVSGIGLSVLGKLRFSGLNTNPSIGAVLTSDASGNAVWKPKKIGFFANVAANTSIPISTFRKVEFSSEQFDHQANFVPYAGATSSSTSVFTAPVSGIYHFASSVVFQHSDVIESGQIRLIKNVSSTVLANYEGEAGFTIPTAYYASLEIEGDFYLNANDRVWVEVAQRNLFSTAIGLNTTAERGRFSGYLKIAD